jgi:hypothetical protein
MAITEEEKQAYNDLIQNLYDGSLNSSPEMISQEVIDIVNTILTKAIAITEELINLLFPSGTLGRLTKDIVTSGLQAIFNWIDAIQGNRIYSICLAQAKLNWKSPLQLALLGI